MLDHGALMGTRLKGPALIIYIPMGRHSKPTRVVQVITGKQITPKLSTTILVTNLWVSIWTGLIQAILFYMTVVEVAQFQSHVW